jgi:hypothetical protein
VNNNINTILFVILSILIIQLMVLFSNEIRFSRLEQKIDQYFAPIDDVDLPKWEEQQ